MVPLRRASKQTLNTHRLGRFVPTNQRSRLVRCRTVWQNLGVAASGAKLQLVAVVNGHDVIVDAAMGQLVVFQAWLPHCTQTASDGPAAAVDDYRLHHTAYIRFGVG